MGKIEEFVKIGSEAMDYLNDCDTYNFFQRVGVLRYIGYGDYATLLSAMYYYRIKDYARCLDTLENIAQLFGTDMKRELKIWYWDYKISALAYLNRFEEIREVFFSGDEKYPDEDIIMSIYSFALVKYLAYGRGFEKDGVGIFRPDGLNEAPNIEDDAFKAFFLVSLGNSLLELYIHNEERLLLKDGGIEKGIKRDLRNQLNERIGYIEEFANHKYIKLGPAYQQFLAETKICINQDRHIDGKGLAALVISIMSKELIHRDIMVWKLVIDISAAVLETEEFLEIFDDESEYVRAKLQQKNEMVANQLVLLMKNPQIGQSIRDGKSFTEEWEAYINHNMPGYLEEHKVYSVDLSIYNRLSSGSRWAYEAAIWQYEQTIEFGDAMEDAGLLSLAFMRILELEINARFIKPLKELLKKEHYDVGANRDFGCLKSDKPLMLGELRYLFAAARNKASEEGKRIKEILENKVLSSSGKTAFENGKLEDIMNQGIIDKYRNPPAHSRYLQKSEAVKAKCYVEEKLKELFTYSR